MTVVQHKDLTCDNDTDENSCQVTATELHETVHQFMIIFNMTIIHFLIYRRCLGHR
jgi:hypothetical protein